jgi:hypothetical protein
MTGGTYHVEVIVLPDGGNRFVVHWLPDGITGEQLVDAADIQFALHIIASHVNAERLRDQEAEG